MQIEAGLSLDNVYLALKNKCIQIYTNIVSFKQTHQKITLREIYK